MKRKGLKKKKEENGTNEEKKEKKRNGDFYARVLAQYFTANITPHLTPVTLGVRDMHALGSRADSGRYLRT